jgi:hypothetical protein
VSCEEIITVYLFVKRGKNDNICNGVITQPCLLIAAGIRVQVRIIEMYFVYGLLSLFKKKHAYEIIVLSVYYPYQLLNA